MSLHMLFLESSVGVSISIDHTINCGKKFHQTKIIRKDKVKMKSGLLSPTSVIYNTAITAILLQILLPEKNQ